MLLLSLSACDDGTEYTHEIFRLQVDVTSDGEEVVVRLSDEDENEDSRTYPMNYTRSVFSEKGVFYNDIKTVLHFDGESIFSATETFLAQYGEEYGVEEFSSLKIVFDYDTIYKSTTSNGERTKIGNNYVHSFEISRTDCDFTLERRYANSSVWYGLSAGITVFAVAIVGIVAVIKRGKYGRKH